jgi:peptide/nickel transport system permease protein
MGRLAPLSRILRTPRGALSAAVLLLIILCAVFAPWIAPFDYAAQKLSASYREPSMANWLGTDEFGRDLLSRIIFGARTSLTVGVTSIGLSVLAGMALGAAAGYFGGAFDRAVTIMVDLSWSFPEILLALILIAILGPGLTSTMIAIGVGHLAQFTRLTRAQIMSLKSETYVEATINMGAGHAHVLFRHLLPNAMAPVIVAGMLATGDAIILEATLGFFGLGAQPPTPSWGEMLRTGKSFLHDAPTYAVFPGLVLTFTILSLDTLGRTLAKVLEDRHEVVDSPGGKP